MNSSVRRAGLIVVLLAVAVVAHAQGKKLRYEAEVEQFADLEGGWLLVPVELYGGGIASGNAQEAAQRQDRRAFEEAFAQGFSLATVLFYNSADTADLRLGLNELAVWDAAGMPPANWPPDPDKVFLLDLKPADQGVGPDVIVTNSIVQRRQARAKMFSEAKQARRFKRAKRLRKRMQHSAAIWDHPKLVRNVRRLNRLEEGRDTTAFEFTTSNFDPNNRDAPGFVLHRYSHKVIIKHEDLRYDFDYHYFVKVHYQTPPEIRYPDAVAFLERKLRARMTYLREKY